MKNTPGLNPKALQKLKNERNLLAFSAGVDSTALFFILLENDIPFDIAIFDYEMREESKTEVAYAFYLSEKYNKKIYMKKSKPQENNFEANARKMRYDFFKDVIKKDGYKNIITAHQLNDRTEWFFMQFTKGAGAVELAGMDYITDEEGYSIIRPMLDVSRDEIAEFLSANNIKHFKDSSNSDERFKRNHFRKNITDALVSEYKNGIKNSFAYLKNDAKALFERSPSFTFKDLTVIKRKDDLQDIREIDFFLKRRGYIISSGQKKEISHTKECVIGAQMSISYTPHCIYISPYVIVAMPKKKKEEYRKARIPPKTRGYLFKNGISADLIQEKIDALL